MSASKAIRVITRQTGQQGFTLIQVIIIVALATVITAFGAIGIVNARAHIRLASSARQFSTRAEKARADSVRRHAMGASMANLNLLSQTSYSVTMDFDINGVIDAWDTQTFNLEQDITFAPEFVGTTITFDWRGRSVTGQVSPTMRLSGGTAITLITVSGAGDITLDAESFPDGSIPDLTLVGNPTADLRPDPPPNPTSTPYPGGGTSPTPTPTPNPDPNATPTPYPTSTPTPTPECNGNAHGCRDGTPTPTATPTPQATPTPEPTATPIPCSIVANPTTLVMANKATKSVTLTVANSPGTTTVSLSSNTNSSHISVTKAPGQTGVVSGNGTVTFNVVMNGKNQQGTLTFTAGSPCGASASVGVNK